MQWYRIDVGEMEEFLTPYDVIKNYQIEMAYRYTLLFLHTVVIMALSGLSKLRAAAAVVVVIIVVLVMVVGAVVVVVVVVVVVIVVAAAAVSNLMVL